MNPQKTVDPITERNQLRSENGQLRLRLERAEAALALTSDKLAATEQALIEVQQESAEIRAELEVARKVAEAAVAVEDARNAIIQERLGDGQELMVSIFEELVLTNTTAQDVLNAAVREYRALTEQLSPGKRAVVDEALEGLKILDQ